MKYGTKGKDKGTIFCVHGNSSSANVYRELLDSNEIHNTRIAIDLHGHGINQNKSISTYSFESYKKLLLKEISEIDDEILLIGNSLGGHLAIEIADSTDKIKGLVIMGTPPLKKPLNLEEAFLPIPELGTFFTENPPQQEIIDTVNIAVKNKKVCSIIIEDFNKANPLVRKSLAIDIAEEKLLNEFEIFTNLKVPKFIIAGDSDPSVKRDYLKHVKENCKEFCSILEIKDCGHYPSIERPKEFINILKKISTQVFN